MTLFEVITENDVFSKVLEKYFENQRDKFTLKTLLLYSSQNKIQNKIEKNKS